MEIENTNHVAPLPKARLPSDAQLDAVMTKILAAYFPLHRDQDLEDEIGELIESARLSDSSRVRGGTGPVGRLAEGRALVLTGGSGSGKSRALQRAFAQRDAFVDRSGIGSSLLRSVTAPSPCTLRQLGKSVLAQLGYEPQRDLKENVVWQMTHHHLRLRGVRFLHIDELQHRGGSGKLDSVLSGLSA